MADGADEDKEEEPTGKKRDEARKEGQIVQSKDLTTLSLLIGGGGASILWFTQSAVSMSIFMQRFCYSWHAPCFA